MRILHVITRLIHGGAQRNTVTCCAQQVRAGHRVWLAYGPIYGPEGSLLDEARASGAELVEVGSLRRAILPWHDLRCTGALRRLVRGMDPEVVHTHSSKAGIVGRMAAWREGGAAGRRAVIHTVHGLPFHAGNPWPVNRLYVGLERWAARRCHRIIGITRAMCDAFVAAGIAGPGRMSVVPSGVDVDWWRERSGRPGQRERVRRELGIASGASVVGVVARLDRLKGQEDVLDAVGRMRRRGSGEGPDVRVLLVGDGWYADTLRKRAAEWGMSERVLFTGLVGPERVAELMSAMDVLVLASHQEGQGRTLVEAMACGVATAGYDVGGVGEVLDGGRVGRLVPAMDRARLGQAIGELLQAPDERKRLAEVARHWAQERFSQRKMVRELSEVYDLVLGQLGRKADG